MVAGLLANQAFTLLAGFFILPPSQRHPLSRLLSRLADMTPNSDPDYGESTCGYQTTPEDRALEPGRDEYQSGRQAAEAAEQDLEADCGRGVRQRQADQVEELIHSQVASVRQASPCNPFQYSGLPPWREFANTTQSWYRANFRARCHPAARLAGRSPDIPDQGGIGRL
jgi:hypothetical protein